MATHSKYNRMPQFLVMLGLCFVLLFWGALPARAVTYDETLDYVARLQALATQYCAESDTEDDPVLLLSIAGRPLSMPPFPLEKIEELTRMMGGAGDKGGYDREP